MTTITHPSFVGFDRIFDQIERLNANKSLAQQFPPHNIIILDQGAILLELAVAGYSMEDIEVIQEKGTLIIQTVPNYTSHDDELKFAHKGISSKKFRKVFTVADNVEILRADLEDGILTIRMQEVIPEEEKPKVIKINRFDQKSDPKFLTE